MIKEREIRATVRYHLTPTEILLIIMMIIIVTVCAVQVLEIRNFVHGRSIRCDSLQGKQLTTHKEKIKVEELLYDPLVVHSMELKLGSHRDHCHLMLITVFFITIKRNRGKLNAQQWMNGKKYNMYTQWKLFIFEKETLALEEFCLNTKCVVLSQ